MPKIRDRRSLTSGSVESWPSTISMRPICVRTSFTCEPGERRVNVAHEPSDEPRTVLALEGDLRIVNEDRSHAGVPAFARAANHAAPARSRRSGLRPRRRTHDDPTSRLIRSSPAIPCRSSRRRAAILRPRSASPAAAARRERAKTSSAFRGPPGSSGAVADRAAGSASRTSPSAIAVSSSLVCETIASAPLEIRERCEASPPTMARRSKIHWKFRPGRPTSGSCITAASNHRLTVTIGRLASAVALATVCSSPARDFDRTARETSATARSRSRAAPRSPRRARERRECADHRSTTFAGALTRTSLPRSTSHARAGSAYSSSSGTAGSTSAAAPGSGPNTRSSTRMKFEASA